MTPEEILPKVQEIIAEIMDIEPETILPNTYLIRELGIESIDLLEIAVDLADAFNRPIDDKTIFLTDLRKHLQAGTDLATVYPHLSAQRIAEMKEDLSNGPVLKVQDLIDYLK